MESRQPRKRSLVFQLTMIKEISIVEFYLP